MDGNIEERLQKVMQLSLDDLLEFGCEQAEAGRLPDAQSCFRRAMDLGSADGAFNLGNCLAEQEMWTEAVDAYEVAIAGGVAEAWLNLGIVLHELGDLAGEIRAYQRAEAEGDSAGPLGLAFALREQGDRKAALAAAQRSARAGNETAAAVAACWQWCTSHDPSLESHLRAGAALFPSARADLGDLLLSTGRIEEARQVLEAGVRLGEVESMLPLGNLYADVLHDDLAAEAAYRAGAAVGDAHSHHNLGVLLEHNGDLAGAEHHYRSGIQGGDTLAIRALRNLLDEK